MQNWKNKTIDTRTFSEIWESLTPDERTELKYAVMAATLVSHVSFYNWLKGATMPSILVRREIVKVISKKLHITTLPQTLFPHHDNDNSGCKSSR